MSRLAAALLVTLLATNAFASGGGEVTLTRDTVQLQFATPRKAVMPEHQKEWSDHVAAWEKEHNPIAIKVAAAIVAIVPRHQKKLGFLTNQFSPLNYRGIDEEGVPEPGGDTGPWRLRVDLELFDSSISNTAIFMLQTPPDKASVRAFAQEVRAAAHKALGRKPPMPFRYTGYLWTPATGPNSGNPHLLLLAAPLAQMPDLVNKSPWRGRTDRPILRSAPALTVALTSDRGWITEHGPDDDRIILRVGGLKVSPTGEVSILSGENYTPPSKVTKLPRATVDKLLRGGLGPKATAAQRTEHADDLEFVASFAAQLQ